MSLGYAIKVRDLIEKKKEEMEIEFEADNDYISDLEIKKIKNTPELDWT